MRSHLRLAGVHAAAWLVLKVSWGLSYHRGARSGALEAEGLVLGRERRSQTSSTLASRRSTWTRLRLDANLRRLCGAKHLVLGVKLARGAIGKRGRHGGGREWAAAARAMMFGATTPISKAEAESARVASTKSFIWTVAGTNECELMTMRWAIRGNQDIRNGDPEIKSALARFDRRRDVQRPAIATVPVRRSFF